ncbi:polymer-forming cytoskeletal protein [Aurantiacibacter sp. MUD11]|uniref:bactofilin family protein n=1 Tax=Aurantiacibacter sp. MUD11 TaxID=3003265 RepID=UPI0022AA4958|nr:polymer-forming cytoskeletal protein [Aurantiacibacter sp. MUD11]WAT17227.1 polymer-forming cytoskeletal protein [Aurantiacibacter sp. MUD11]
MANPGGTFSVIGPDVTIKGDIEASVDLHVDGKVTGNLACASLVQGETSRIEGEIKAESARLSGEVQGTIEVRDLVVLKSAKIHGDVSYDTLTIEQGASVDGRFAPLRAKAAPSGQTIKAGGDKPATPMSAEEQRRLSLAG